LSKRTVSGIALTLLFIGMLTLAFDIHPVKASGTIYIRADGSVEPDTAPISSVDNVTYTFTDNIYDEIVVERDNIVVDGVGYTVQGTGSGNGIYLSGRSNVTIKNMEIKAFYDGIRLYESSNNTISGNIITQNNWCGICLLGFSSFNTVSGNSITANKLDGIYFTWSSSFNTISGNKITNNDDGIVLRYSSNYNKIYGNSITANNDDGICLFDYSSFNTISGNIITQNNWCGIWLYKSSNNTISGNIITQNRPGIWLDYYSSFNTISGNIITQNNWCGICLLGFSSFNTVSGNSLTANIEVGIRLDYWSSNNTIYHNNFVDNTEQVYSGNPTNVWDDGYPSGGNYWSDYTGADLCNGPYQNETGSDGIGDTPYVIDADNQDRYPLMHPWSSLPVHNINTGLGYATIQEAIDALETLNGHTIFVEAGTYYENVLVNKRLSLVGENRYATIIDGSGRGTVVDVTANDVVINRFTVQNSQIGRGGIRVFPGANTCNISNNNIINNEHGVLFYSSGNILSDNDITANRNIGVQLYDSSGNIMTGNNIANSLYALILYSSVPTSSNNIFSDNKIANNWRSVYLERSTNNKFYHNDFINNTSEWVVTAYESANIWDDGYPSGGNYWSDYAGVDVKGGPNQDQPSSDGIGDTAYVIDENNQDNYPFMDPNGWLLHQLTQLTVTSSPVIGITFTIDGIPETTPCTRWLLEGFYILQMPESHNGYVWSHWVEDGDPNRTKTITLPGTTWTGVFVFDVQPHGPEAEFEATPDTASTGESIKFDASSSLPGYNGIPEMPITEYRWDFADGNQTITSTPIVYHSFSNEGIYYVTLTVYAPGATPETDSTTKKVTITAIPVGGYLLPIKGYIMARPLTLYLAVVAILTVSFTIAKRRKKQQN